MTRIEQLPGLLRNLAAVSPWKTPELSEFSEIIEGLHKDSFPLYWAAFSVFQRFSRQLFSQPRWRNYLEGLEEEDTNVGEHTLRQTSLTAHALIHDVSYFCIDVGGMDLMLAGSFSHDLGEAVTGDTTYDHKRGGNKKAMEPAEVGVTLMMIDSTDSIDEGIRQQLKEAYLRITTSLDDKDILKLLGEPTELSGKINWQQLRQLFELYERYGYLITALQTSWPLVFEEGVSFSEADRGIVRKWNRNELEEALSQGQGVPEHIGGAILTKNVLLNQWPCVVEAINSGIPSAKALFNNSMTKKVVVFADQLMELELDLSVFSRGEVGPQFGKTARKCNEGRTSERVI